MREFKFRVWDIEAGEYGDPSLLEVFNSNGILGHLYDPNKEKTIIQQYTGVNDINGKEIYEGDIVIWPLSTKDENIPNPYRGEDRGWYFYTTRQKPKIVEWTHYLKFALCDIPQDGSMTYSFNQYCEVIGNIYENPELLNL